jgi:hypothetical protein
MEFIKPKLIDSPSLSIGQDDASTDKVSLSFIEFGEYCARSRFGYWHDVGLL